MAPTIDSASRVKIDHLAMEARLQNSTATAFTTAAGSDFIETWIVVVQMFHEAYIYPVFIVIALLANLFIIGVFLRPVAVKRFGLMTRVYYLIIALSDICYLFSYDLMVNFAVCD